MGSFDTQSNVVSCTPIFQIGSYRFEKSVYKGCLCGILRLNHNWLFPIIPAQNQPTTCIASPLVLAISGDFCYNPANTPTVPPPSPF